MTLALIEPDWPAPARVRAATTTRRGGTSRGPFASLNLALHVDDDPAAVAANRRLLREALELPAEPRWLQQVHGCDVADVGGMSGDCASPVVADAAVAAVSGEVCAVLTADCLPVLLCDRAGTTVAAVHAGWRGLLNGVIEAAVDRLSRPPEEIMAWLGPAIGPDAFEVGPEVRAAFRDRDPAAAAAFKPTSNGRYLADLYALARDRLASRGIIHVSGGRYCTVGDSEQFYSYRRDGRTGRMASLIWLQ